MKEITKNTAKNTALLYILTFAKLVFPLLTLPYLTRVLTTESYGIVAYVKSIMTYLQIFVDFGFMHSAVKDIVEAKNDKKEISLITTEVMFSKVILAILAMGAGYIFCLAVPILKNYTLFTMLYSLSIALSAFLLTYLFRGIEKMHVLTFVYVAMKGVSTILTFVLVKNSSDILWIPILEILGTLVAVVVSFFFMKSYGINFVKFKIINSFRKLKESLVYFISGVATTAFSALNTLLIGLFIKDLTIISYWSVSLQLVNAIQNMYDPINKGIYPQMIKHKSFNFIGKVLLVFMPIVLLGSGLCFILAKWVILVFGGAEYINAVPIFRGLIPLLIISFPSMLFGWPTLGAISKQNSVTLTTIVSALVQVVGLLLLALFNAFTIAGVIILRCLTEMVLMLSRLYFILKYKKEFKGE